MTELTVILTVLAKGIIIKYYTLKMLMSFI